jgi:hypothetical protein
MAKTPYQPDAHSPDSQKSVFLPHAAAVALGGQVTAIAKIVGPDESSWFPRKKIVPPVPLLGANCALGTIGSVTSQLRACRTTHQRHLLSHAKLTIAHASVQEATNGFVTTTRSAAVGVKIGLVEPVTFPHTEVKTTWTYGSEGSQTLDLKIRFGGYQVQGCPLVRVKIRSSWRGLTFDSLAKQIDDGSLTPLPWSRYPRDKSADQLAVSLAPKYHVHIPAVGHLFFAELSMTREQAVFSLVRLALGSVADGHGVIGYALPNGGRFP